MGTTNLPEDIVTRIRDLERQVKELRRATLAGAVLSSGSLEVRDPTDGHVIVRAGVHDYGGGPVPGLAIFRNDGSTAFWAFDNTAEQGYVTIYDGVQNELIKPDVLAGQGLSTPWLSDNATPWSRVLTPPETTTSASFATLWRCHRTKQHPRVRIALVAKCSLADTSGEIRLSVNGTQVSSTLALPLGNYGYHGIWANLAGSHLSDVYVDVDARRTAGTGTVGVEVVDVQGCGS